ncbi:MAG TPA: serine/threonine-protein kinase [Polyangia bacterium]|nr:serine/threonine-protein kinase [Polyangia bacterium]
MYREPDAFLHQVVGGRWRLLEVLGPTEHGTAFRAETVEDGPPVRLELWDPRHVEQRGELARFEREARTLSRLRHERCVSVVAFGSHDGHPFLVSDLPAGKSLADELRAGDLTVPRAVSLGLQLCEGLQHLHGHGVVHRALRPDNVWIATSSAADVLKIGLPRIGPAPEGSGARPDHRADVLAAGWLLYAMCTGRAAPADALAGAPVPPPSTIAPERGISDGLERVILRAVAPSREREGRYATADELRDALLSAGIQPATGKRGAGGHSASRTAMLAIAFVTVAILGAGALRSRGGQAPVAAPAATPELATPAASAPPPAPPPPPATAVVKAPPPPPAPAAPPPPAPPKQAPAPVVAVAPRAPDPAVPRAPAPAHGAHAEIWALLDSGRLDEGATRIKALVAQEPDAAWPRLALGVLFYRKYWRRDAVRQWQEALQEDPEIRHDPQFGAYLCFMLDDSWKAAGMTELLDHLGAKAVPLLESCAASAKTPQLRAIASRTLDQLRRPGRRSRH